MLTSALAVEMMAAIQAYFDSNSTYVDIMSLDVVWTGMFEPNLVPLNSRIPASRLAQYHPTVISAAYVRDKLVALPDKVDFGVLYSRSDILAKYGYTKPPETWDEMEKMMATILPEETKIRPELMGFIGQIKPYEGLTCNIMEWLVSEGAGPIVDPMGALPAFGKGPLVDKMRNVATRMRRWMKRGYIGPASIGSAEFDSSLMFAAGRSLFHRNWPFVTAIMADANVNWTWTMSRLPGAIPGMTAGALGGAVWGVSKYSSNVDAAVQVLQFLSSTEFQKARAVAFGNPPSITSLYTDPDVRAVLQYPDLFLSITPAPRPAGISGPNYDDVSGAIYSNWFDALIGVKPVDEALDTMHRSIARIVGIDILGAPTNVVFGDPLAVTMVALTLAGLAGTVIIALHLVALRNRAEIKKAAPIFMHVALVGIAITYTSVFVYVELPTRATCALQPIILSVGFTVTMGTMLLKNFRIWKIMNNPYSKRIRLPNRTLFIWLGGLLGVDALLFVLWMAIDPPVPTDVKLASSRYTACLSSSSGFQSAMVGLLYAYKTALLLASLWVALQTRRAGKGFSESKTIGFGVYNVALISIIAVPLSYMDGLTQAYQFGVRSIAILLATSTLELTYFLPKLWAEYRAPSTKPTREARGDNNNPAAGPAASFQAGAAALFSPVAGTPLGGSPLAITKSTGLIAAPGGGGGNAHVVHGSTHDSVSASTAAAAAAGFISRDLGFAREGILSFRAAPSRLRLQLAPWKPARAILLPGLGIWVFHHLQPPSTSDSTTIALDSIYEISMRNDASALLESASPASSGNGPDGQSVIGVRSNESTSVAVGARFMVRAAGEVFEVMAVSANEASTWVAAVSAARRAANSEGCGMGSTEVALPATGKARSASKAGLAPGGARTAKVKQTKSATHDD
ncbi:hypothetical protein H9P43_000114 [Blastocladiella emersonii ATCC 22665]|nr:hypothetical protein H9P43_000114 [Blastocladiella emersonii ATCC 22665]